MRDPAVEERLLRHRSDLVRFVRARAGRLLRFETAEDLTQAVHLQALERGGNFEMRSEEQFLAWMYSVARSFLADRRAHWSALKRGSGDLLRISGDAGATTDPRAVSEPPLDATGPSTFASRREQVVLAMRALDILVERDRRLVQAHAEGHTVTEIAERMELSYDAARFAVNRALDRFRKAHRVLSLNS